MRKGKMGIVRSHPVTGKDVISLWRNSTPQIIWFERKKMERIYPTKCFECKDGKLAKIVEDFHLINSRKEI